MKRVFIGLVSIILFASVSFAQNKNQSTGSGDKSAEILTEAKRAIDKGNAQWVEAWEKNDPSMIASIFTENGVILSSSGKVIKGHQQIHDAIKAFMQALGKGSKVGIATTNVWVDGDTAYETGKSTYTYQQDGKTVADEGRYATSWKRQKDGSWKLAVAMSVP